MGVKKNCDLHAMKYFPGKRYKSRVIGHHTQVIASGTTELGLKRPLENRDHLLLLTGGEHKERAKGGLTDTQVKHT